MNRIEHRQVVEALTAVDDRHSRVDALPRRAGHAGVGEHETMLSIDKARRVLGFEPQHSWRG
jgi:nucleoside-diphosphate-sugar epimerase